MLTKHKWRKNKDGSMSGLITGSELFEHGQSVTTTYIRSGNAASDGNIVQNGSRCCFLHRLKSIFLILFFLVCRYFLIEKSSGIVPSFLNFGGTRSISNSDSSSSQTTVSLAQTKQVSVEEAKKTKTTTSR